MTTPNKLAAALVAARRKFGPALKDKANPAFRSKYADLGACLDAVDDALLEAGIAVTQETFEDEKGVTVETVLIHESGEERRFGKLHVPAAKHDPQGFGSALTYARRYSLMAACGIAPEDDDGNAGTKATREAAAAAKAKADAEARAQADRQAELDELALYLIDAHENGKDMDAIRVWYENFPPGVQDSDDKLYVWGLLKTQSKLRSAIKSNKPETVAA